MPEAAESNARRAWEYVERVRGYLREANTNIDIWRSRARVRGVALREMRDAPRTWKTKTFRTRASQALKETDDEGSYMKGG